MGLNVIDDIHHDRIKTFEIAGDPMGKERPRFTGKVVYTPRKTLLYENKVKQSYPGGKLEGNIVALITAVFPIPKSTKKSDVALMIEGKIKPKKRPDLDNIAKIILDSLNGIAYDDDAQIVSLYISKVYGDQAKTKVMLFSID